MFMAVFLKCGEHKQLLYFCGDCKFFKSEATFEAVAQFLILFEIGDTLLSSPK
jgi:hypothetical protein